ncbi:MAG: GNAT family N-acetyltransferase [Anaerotignum sp.]|nr:GNAT family N-acetyltransferase [Anaerotignum sp.]
MLYTIKYIEKTDFQEALPFLFASAQKELALEGFIWMTYGENGPCGALGALEKDGILRVSSLYVKPENRNQGVASQLIREAEQLAETIGMTGISFSYACDREKALLLDRFFLKNGYTMPIEGNTMMTFRIADIEKSAFAKLTEKLKPSGQIVPFTAISGQGLENLKTKVESKIPFYMTLFDAAGKPIPELTIAYIHHGSVSAYITITDDNGMLHFDAAYLDNTSETAHLLMLMKQAYETIKAKYPQYQLMSVTGKTDSGMELINKLLQDVPMQYTSEYMAEKEIRQTRFLRNGYGEAVAYFNTLTEWMAQERMVTGLVMIDGQLPYMEIYTEEEKVLFGLYYSLDTMAEERMFIAESIFSVADEIIRHNLVKQVNEEESPYYVIVSEETGNILLRRSYEGVAAGETLDMEKMMQEFILPFQRYAAELIEAHEGTLF